jgi:peroxiredoxin Q/BCP
VPLSKQTIMVELRKRPAPPPAAPPAKKKAAPKSKAKKDDAKAEEPVAEEPAAAADNAAVEESAKDAIAETSAKTSSSPASPPKQGDTIELESFGGEVETNDGQKVTLAQLVQSSKKGVVLFTYPKASTP